MAGNTKPAPFALQLLIVEDIGSQQEELEEWFRWWAKKAGLTLRLYISSFAGETQQALEQKYFHAVSLDVRLPEQRSGQIIQDLGLHLAEAIRREQNPAIAAIYTAFPSVEAANDIGRKTGFPYRSKAAASAGTQKDGSGLTFKDYTAWFLDHFRRNYLKKVLELAKASGHQTLAKHAEAALNHYDDGARPDALNSNIRAYLQAMDALRESLLRHVAALFHAIWPEQSHPGACRSTHELEQWLEALWNAPEVKQDRRFRNWCAYMQLEQETPVERYIAQTLRPLRQARNKDAHHAKYYSATLLQRLEPALLRLGELLHWFVTRPMINRPNGLHDGLFQCHELRFFPPREMQYFTSLPLSRIPSGDANTIYTKLTPNQKERLIDISSMWKARENNKGEPRLMCDFCK